MGKEFDCVYVVLESGYSEGDEFTTPLQAFPDEENAIRFIEKIVHDNGGTMSVGKAPEKTGKSGHYVMREEEYGEIDYILTVQKIPFNKNN